MNPRILSFRFHITFIVAFIIHGTSLLHASSRTVSGNISENTTWSEDTVIVEDLVNVNSGITLTILPGTYVEFQGYFPLSVNGKLLAIGNETEPITFTVHDTAGFSNLLDPAGAWHGIRFENYYNPDTSVLEYCIIEFGKAISGDFSNTRGGGICAFGHKNLLVSNCTIRNCYSLSGGGGICLYESNAQIMYTTIVDNGSDSQGGGILARFDNPVISHNTICNNQAPYGGGIRFTSCDATLVNNLIYNNEALSSGGGIRMTTTDLLSMNNTICYNKAFDTDAKGGGIMSGDQCKPVFYNDIIWGNEATEDGSQVYLFEFNPDFDFYNCNIQGGLGDFGLQPGSVFFGQYTDCLDIEPGFGLLPPGTGLITDPLNVDFSLVDGSPCINMGANEIMEIYPISTDVAYNRRISYSDIDIGAYEYRKASMDAVCTIVENTTWTADTIKVDCDIEVPDAITLTINPGAIVQFQGPHRIMVYGTLLALGTETDTIVFTIKDTLGFSDATSGAGSWRGIEFRALATNDSSKILYSRLEYSKRIDGTVYEPFGGAIYAGLCYRLLISNSLITRNMAETGGGIQCSTSPITIRNSTISHNRAVDVSHGKGGGIFCHSSNVNLIGCTVEYNTCTEDGGGICVYRCEPNITNCRIENNTAAAAGGGLYSLNDAHPFLTGNIITDNQAGSGGGVYLLSPGYLSKNLISNNHAGGGAGVYAVADEDVVLANNIICNNYADYHAGAGVIDALGTKMINNTIVNNYAGSQNGGLVINESGVTIENSIIWGNKASGNTYQIDIGNIDEFPDITYTNIQGGLESIDFYAPSGYPGLYEHNLDSIPGFVQPSDSAGVSFEGTAEDWSLLDISPSVNSGNPLTDDPDVLPIDLAGNPRIHMSVIDMGALENQSPLPVITEQPLNYSRCTGDSVRFSVKVTGDVTYQWQYNQTDIREANSDSYLIESVETVHDGNYQCIIRNAYAVLYSNPALLRVKSPPEILLQPEDTWAKENEEVTMRVIAAGTDPEYQWRRNGTDLPGKIINELSIPESGYEHEGSYDCVISNACGADTTDPVNLYIAPQICMVTVDEETGDNLVVWEKETTAPILAYNVYRESVAAGIYDLLVSMPYGDLSQFLDTVADPTVQAYIYKITATDMEGKETDIDLCKPHKTIHLLVTTNPELNTTQLAWDHYYGFEYPSYTIYRSVDRMNFDSIHSISANLNSWTDPEASDGDFFYRIAVRKPDPCVPTGGKKKEGTGPYNHSLSNMDDNKLKAGENPPDTLMLDNHSIYENMLPGSLVGRLTTVDKDTLDYHTYQLVSGDGDSGNGSFSLIGNLLVSATTFDYETQDSYSVRIRSTDNAAFYVEGVFAITVNDTEEGSGTATGAQPPDTVFMDNYSIQENNLFGDLVGRLVTIDPDTFDVHTYQLVSGTGDEDNAVFSILGNMLIAAHRFDFEEKAEYSIRVRSTDLGYNYIENSFVINIVDVDETVGIAETGDGEIRIFPNPFSHSTTIRFPNLSGEPYRATLRDISGKLVWMREDITSNEFILQGSGLGKGLYILELTGEKTCREKLVIE